jgi:putative salt-induced outer membrane protein YdiY
MNTRTLASAAALFALFVGTLAADVVETKDGARIVGTVTRLEDGNVFVKTTYAGDIAIKQSEVTGITTDSPVTVRLSSGTVLNGKLTTEAGAVKIAGADGELTTKVEKVAASWPTGTEDPMVTAHKKALAEKERHWTYEVSADMTGKTGNSEQLGTTAAARATLKTSQDTLLFYSGYNRQVSDGSKSADQFKAGVDYQNNFAGKLSWYVRDEGGFDRVKDVDLYNVAAAGIGYDVIKEEKHTLTGRVGLAYRYEGYRDPSTEDVSTAGLDLGVNHEWTFSNSKLVNRIAFIPAFSDFSNFRLTHESFYEVPLVAPFWKLRVGISNDYNSKPGIGVEKLDTSYFTRLVLTWQ